MVPLDPYETMLRKATRIPVNAIYTKQLPHTLRGADCDRIAYTLIPDELTTEIKIWSQDFEPAVMWFRSD